MSGHYYPIITTQHLSKSINFYEDYFGFVAEQEMDCFAVLVHEKHSDIRLGLINQDHHTVPDRFHKNTQGLIINFPVESVNQMYRHLFLEGLDIEGEPALAPCGRRHFFVEDPNGILIDVMENYDPFTGENDNDEFDEMMKAINT